MKIDKLITFLKCIQCDFEELNHKSDKIVCPRCQTIFDVKEGVPIMINRRKLNNQERKQIKIYNRHYIKNSSNDHPSEKWQQSMINRVVHSSALGFVRTYLDIGSSADAYTVIEAAKKEWLSVGLNISTVAMTAAKKNADKLGLSTVTGFVVGSAENLPFRDNLFDYISLVSVLEHIKNDYNVVGQLASLLRPAGHVFVCVPNSYARIWPFFWPVYYLLDKLVGHKRHYSIATLNRIMRERDLLLRDVKYNGHLIKIIQLILEKINLINDNKWWEMEQTDINSNSYALQLNALYKKK